VSYDFERIIERRGSNCLKYDFARERGKPEGLLPLWVADMDFPAPPEVLADMQKAIAHGIFGYSEAKEDYYQAVSNWFASRFALQVTQDEIIKTPGVVFALAEAVRALSEPNEAVLIQTPVYYPFFEVVRANGRKLVTNPLRYEDGRYVIDFADFERKISENAVKLFILCSPHNPGGRVWTEEELARMNSICLKHGVTIVSDEIHCDFVWSKHPHISLWRLNENAIIATAPSKTFNLAGLQVSNIFVRNPELREKLKAGISRSGYAQLNTLGLIACQSAYMKGGAWLSALQAYLLQNIRILREFLSERLPEIRLMEPEGTYLLWLDFSRYGLPQNELDRRITEGAKLWLSSGTTFGADGKGFQRLNIACPSAVLIEALTRLEKEFSL